VKQKKQHSVPDRDAIVAFIGAQPKRVGTREIARHFGLKNSDRAALKDMLRQLEDEGFIDRRRHNLTVVGQLPPTLLATIIASAADGTMIAAPRQWDEDENGPAPRIRVTRSRRGGRATIGQRVLLKISRDDNGTDYHGEIIHVIDEEKGRIIGMFRGNASGGGRFESVDKKFFNRDVIIRSADTMGAQDGDLVSIEPPDKNGFGPARARVIERFGSIRSEKAISLIAIHAHDLPFRFSPEAIAEAEIAEPASLKGREDWRALPLVTIDPPDARDHDDAVFAEIDPDPANKGGFIIYVAIADVSFYVRPGSDLDQEAVNRGNSVYFPGLVVPMLPERISNDLCSLVPGSPRGALMVRMVVDGTGRKRNHSFHRILMRSAAKLHYAQAQAAIDANPDDVTAPLLETVLKPLFAAYSCVRRARDKRDPLELEIPERKILLKDDGTVDRVIVPQRLDAHRLIEEFMILANVAAAETLEKHASPLIYRVHDTPSFEKVQAFRDFLRSLDIPLAKSATPRPGLFNHILKQVEERDVAPMVSEIVLRTQAQAEYSCDNCGHFGLNLKRYAHFTSPIRRYADLVVHRALVAALQLGEGGLPHSTGADKLRTVAQHISMTERRAMKAERETSDRLIAHYLKDRVGASFKGRITGVTRAGLFVRLDDTGADGLVPTRSLGDEYFEHNETRHALIGEDSGVTYQLGDAVELRLLEVSPLAGALRFQLLSEGKSAKRSVKKSKKSFQKAARRR